MPSRNAYPLPLADGKKRVHAADPQIELLFDQRSFQGVGNLADEGIRDAGRYRSTKVQGLPEAIENPSQHSLRHQETIGRLENLHQAPRADAGKMSQRT